MSRLSVSEAAERLGVTVARIYQRIADGSLRAERIGSQWVVDERSLLWVAERRAAGRPLSTRSTWAVIAASEGDEESLGRLAPTERARARGRLAQVLSAAEDRATGEDDARVIAAILRSMFRNRAERRLFRVATGDVDDLRADDRWVAWVSSSASGIASSGVEGYVAQEHVDRLVHDFLLVPELHEASVVVHVIPDGQNPYPDSKVRLAADLAEHRGPREEARAVELLRELARERRLRQR